MRRLAVAFGVVLLGACGDSSEGADHVERLEQKIVGGTVSTAADDFVVYVARTTELKQADCGSTLVAPNLVLTAKHCVRDWPQDKPASFCDATGEPQIGSQGGYVTGDIPMNELAVFSGGNGRGRYYVDKAPPDANGKQVVDDKTLTLCSHDLAYLVLDKPLSGMPIGKLRLGARPEVGSKIAVAGWGRAEQGPPYNGRPTTTRLRRANVTVQRVGLPAAEPGATGSLGPRTFETGPGGCTGDSGGPGFDPQTLGVVGVLVRALNTDPENAVSPCAPDTVSNVYINVADFGKELREAFAAAGAEPWIEGHSGAGFARFGEACSSNLECAGDLCIDGECNVACEGGARACPSGYICGSSGGCEVTTALPPPAETSSPAAAEEPVVVTPSPDSCAISGRTGQGSPPGGRGPLVAIAACALVARRLGSKSRKRP